MKSATRLNYQESVQAAVERLHRELDQPLDFRDLAERAHLSAFHFHRIFSGMVGETPGEFARRLRLERAAFALRRTEKPVIEVAMESGYESHQAFTRAFRAAWGMSPSEFRQKPIVRFELAATCGVHYRPDGVVPLFVPHDTGGRSMNVEVTDMPEFRIGAVRHIGPYNQIPEAFARLGAIAGPAGLFAAPDAFCLAIYHDDPETTPPAELKSDAAIRLPEGSRIPAGLEEQTIPGGKYARYTHLGPYEGLGDAWARFMGEWLPASGHKFLGPTYEIYRNDPQSTPPQDLQTDLYLRVE